MTNQGKVLFICISLKQCVERRSDITQQLQTLQALCPTVTIEYEFFDAIYGKDLAPEYHAFINTSRELGKQCKRPLCTGEVGCMLSHMFLWQRIAEHRYAAYDRVVIIEDDVYLAPHHQLNQQLLSLVKNPADFIFLSGHSKKARTRIWGYVSDDQTYFNMIGSRYHYTMACAYSITPARAAKLIHKIIAKITVADDWKYLLADAGSLPYYYLFEQGGENDSTIGCDNNREQLLSQNKESRLYKNFYKITQDLGTYLKLLFKFWKISKLQRYINNLK